MKYWRRMEEQKQVLLKLQDDNSDVWQPNETV